MDTSEIMKRIISHRGVKQLMVINNDGLPLKMVPDTDEVGEGQVRSLHELAGAARRMVRDVDPTDDLVFLRVCSKSDEILVSPDKTFTVVVVQDNHDKQNAIIA